MNASLLADFCVCLPPNNGKFIPLLEESGGVRYTFTTLTNREEITNSISTCNKPLLVVELAHDLDESNLQIEQIRKARFIGRYPLLLLRPYNIASEVTDWIAPRFQTFKIIEIGSSFTSDEFKTILGGIPPLNIKKSEVNKVVKANKKKDFKLIPAITFDELRAKTSNILSTLKNTEKSLEGHSYLYCLSTLTIDSISNDQNPKNSLFLRKQLEQLSLWTKQQTLRRCFVTQSLLKDYPEIETLGSKVALASSLLFNIKTLDSENYSRVSLLRGDNADYQLLAEKVYAEMSTIINELQDSELESVFNCYYKCLINKQFTCEDPFELLATSIFFADTLGRECFQYDTWDGFAIYRVFRWLESLDTVGTKVFSLIGKYSQFLTEIAENSLINPAHENNLTIQKSESDSKKISQLREKMTLETNLGTDNRPMLVTKGTTLTNDILWRIWRVTCLGVDLKPIETY
jgi:hypothetical protein